MLRRMITYLIVLSAGLLITAPSSERERRHIDATSFLDAPSINVSLIGCEPFKFTAGLSDAIAGRPIMIRYVDNRDLEKQSGAR